MPNRLVIHRWCPQTDSKTLLPIGKSRDEKLTHLARSETRAAFQWMSREGAKSGVHLHVIWAYRAPELQHEQFEEAKLKHGSRNGIKWLAPPGFSEHQTGWVLDIGD